MQQTLYDVYVVFDPNNLVVDIINRTRIHMRYTNQFLIIFHASFILNGSSIVDIWKKLFERKKKERFFFSLYLYGSLSTCIVCTIWIG